MAKSRKATRGPRGFRGLPGVPGILPAALLKMTNTVDMLQADAEIQFKRIAQLQAQLDLTLKTLHEMGEKAGRQRKTRKK
jgi:hypothetical protein